MHPVIKKTFAGLSPQYYFRQFFFGLVFLVLYCFMASQGKHTIPIGMIILIVVDTLLYPYSRFVYESIINFIIGDNVFTVNAILMLFVKWITMAFCWGFAIFVAPIGLIYLYILHSKAKIENPEPQK